MVIRFKYYKIDVPNFRAKEILWSCHSFGGFFMESAFTALNLLKNISAFQKYLIFKTSSLAYI